jgi:Zn-finger nucleic acid-binding protein
MFCPNDNAEMRLVKILSQYGGPIFVDQCQRCGGIWFDESELFRAGQGEAEKIESVNAGMLRSPSAIESFPLVCPRDQGTMRRFADNHFPEDIVLVRCEVCHGFWLNRGVFTKYQQFRQETMPPKKIIPYEGMKGGGVEDEWGPSYEEAGPTQTWERLAEFLSVPMKISERSVFLSPIGAAVEDIVENIAGFLAKTITKLLFPGWEG